LTERSIYEAFSDLLQLHSQVPTWRSEKPFLPSALCHSSKRYVLDLGRCVA